MLDCRSLDDYGLFACLYQQVCVRFGSVQHSLSHHLSPHNSLYLPALYTHTVHLYGQVGETCQELKDHMFSKYEEHGAWSCGMEARLQELSEVLGRSSQLSVELQGACQTLVAINKGIQQTSEQ